MQQVRDRKDAKRRKMDQFEPEIFTATDPDIPENLESNYEESAVPVENAEANESHKKPRNNLHDKTEEFDIGAIAQLKAEDLPSKQSKKKKERYGKEETAAEDESATPLSDEAPKGILKRSTADLVSETAAEDADAFEVAHDTTEPTKKIKKPKKTKEEKQKAKEAEKSAAIPAEAHIALQYLRTWKTNRASWNFQKVRQVWLLRNWKDVDVFPENDFGIFLEYITPLKGGSRQKTADEAKAFIDEYEATESYGEDSIKKQKIYDRAVRVSEAVAS